MTKNIRKLKSLGGVEVSRETLNRAITWEMHCLPFLFFTSSFSLSASLDYEAILRMNTKVRKVEQKDRSPSNRDSPFSPWLAWLLHLFCVRGQYCFSHLSGYFMYSQTDSN